MPQNMELIHQHKQVAVAPKLLKQIESNQQAWTHYTSTLSVNSLAINSMTKASHKVEP